MSCWSKITRLCGMASKPSSSGTPNSRSWKKPSSADLLDALRAVSKGGSYLSSQVSDHLLTRIQRGDLEARAQPGPLDGLSPREQQVLRLVAEGKTSKD